MVLEAKIVATLRMVENGRGDVLDSGHVLVVEACTVCLLCENSASWTPVIWAVFLMHVYKNFYSFLRTTLTVSLSSLFEVHQLCLCHPMMETHILCE